jgi:hypothetical protein
MAPGAVSTSIPITQQGRVNPTPPIRANSGNKDGFKFWGEDGFTFGDLVDLVNPLQHIPIVSTLYRKITGDTLATGPRLLGGALFGSLTGGVGVALGSIVGFTTAAANSLVEQKTGRDIGEHALALLYEPEKPTVVAAAAPPTAPSEIPPIAKYDQKVSRSDSHSASHSASRFSTPTPPNWTSYALAAALDKYAQSLRLAAPQGIRVNVNL